MPLQISQFGNSEIPLEIAKSLCGPAAAIAFSHAVGRNPTLQEAQALAEQVGWTSQAGMAGPKSQQQLLQKMGISADLTDAPDWQRITGDVQRGSPVTISTPRHYFTVSDYDPVRGYYVGASGTDLKDGKEWMTADEIGSKGEGINGVLHLNDPTSKPAPAAASPVSTKAVGSLPSVDPVDERVRREQASSAFARKIMGQVDEVPGLGPSPYKMPGLPQIDLGWGRPRFRMPG